MWLKSLRELFRIFPWASVAWMASFDFVLHRLMNAILKSEEPAGSEVMFFSDAGSGCRAHIYNRAPCKEGRCAYTNIRKIIDYMERATRTLDICIYLVTCHGLADAILGAHARGVRVRVIADADMADGSGSRVGTFEAAGIPVRMKESPFLMHHKFFVVDNCILVTGSFNWTMQAITGNWDNVIIAYDPAMVQPFTEHFQYLWDDFEQQLPDAAAKQESMSSQSVL